MSDALLIADSLVKQGIDDFHKGNVDTAIDLFTAALQHNSTSVCAYANRATAYYTQGSYQQALNDLSRALELAPNLFALYVNRGLTYNKLGEIDRSIADFGHAIRLDPKHFGHHFDQAIVLAPQEPQTTAKRTATAISVSYTLTIIARKELYESTSKLFNAISEFCSEVGMQWDEITTRKAQFDSLKFMLSLYDQAIAKDSNNPLLYWDRSCLLSNARQYDQAIADLNQGLQLMPTNSVFWSNRGVMHYNLLNLSKALSDFTKALGLNPNSAEVYANRAIVLIKLQQIEAAIADLDRAIQITPDNTVVVHLRKMLCD